MNYIGYSGVVVVDSPLSRYARDVHNRQMLIERKAAEFVGPIKPATPEELLELFFNGK